MSFNGSIVYSFQIFPYRLQDSGGFQMVSLLKLAEITEVWIKIVGVLSSGIGMLGKKIRGPLGKKAWLKQN